MIPKTFEILGVKVRVEYRKTLHKKQGALGMWYLNENKILLQESTKEYPMDEAQIEQAFFHELIHCILDKLGYTKESEDERFVDTVGSCLHQVIKTMKY